MRVFLDHGKAVDRFFVRQDSVTNHMNPTDDRRQWRAQLMRDRGQKLVFGTAGRFRLATRTSLFFKEPRVVYRQGDPIGDQLQQPCVVVGKLVSFELSGMYDAYDSSPDEQRHTKERPDSLLAQ